MASRASPPVPLWTQGLLCAVYVAAGKLGLALAFIHASASAVWPPTGIALAAFLVLGWRAWPAIFLGAFLVNVTTAGTIATSLGIAAGNTLEGVVGAYLVGRLAGGRHFTDRAQDIFKFVALAGMLSTVVSATVGVTTLTVAGYAPWAAYGSIWLTWWLGDAAGALIVTPVLVLWATRPRVRLSWREAIEAVFLVLAIVAAGAIAFGGVPAKSYPLTFVTIPPLIWAAFRFGRRTAATAVLAVAAIAIWGTLRGFGSFALGPPNESLLVLQGFMATIAMMTLTVAAVVAERKRAEEEREELLVREHLAREEAEDANRAKDEFLATLSHELRTPLNAVLGWTSMLRTGGLDAATVAKALETIERNARVQAKLVEDLLDVSRIILGGFKLGMELVPLPAVIAAAVDGIRPTAAAKGVRLDVRVDDPATVLGDVGRLQQIVSNLVANGVKFTPPGGHVTVALGRVADRARIEVSDTGPGISPAFLPHMFKRFRQADSTMRRAHGGLGLGLAIVRHLAELHGGSVRAESRGVDQGATFIVELPLARP